jgi:hypothetical protein
MTPANGTKGWLYKSSIDARATRLMKKLKEQNELREKFILDLRTCPLVAWDDETFTETTGQYSVYALTMFFPVWIKSVFEGDIVDWCVTVANRPQLTSLREWEYVDMNHKLRVGEGNDELHDFFESYYYNRNDKKIYSDKWYSGKNYPDTMGDSDIDSITDIFKRWAYCYRQFGEITRPTNQINLPISQLDNEEFEFVPVNEPSSDGNEPEQNIPGVTGVEEGLIALGAMKKPKTYTFTNARKKFNNLPQNREAFKPHSGYYMSFMDGISYWLPTGYKIDLYLTEDIDKITGHKGFLALRRVKLGPYEWANEAFEAVLDKHGVVGERDAVGRTAYLYPRLTSAAYGSWITCVYPDLSKIKLPSFWKITPGYYKSSFTEEGRKDWKEKSLITLTNDNVITEFRTSDGRRVNIVSYERKKQKPKWLAVKYYEKPLWSLNDIEEAIKLLSEYPQLARYEYQDWARWIRKRIPRPR